MSALPTTMTTTAATSSPPSSSTKPGTRKKHWYLHFSAGMISGILSATLLQPVDLLKTRVQQRYHATSGPVPAPTLRTVLSTIFAPPPPPNLASTTSSSSIPSQPSTSRIALSVRELWRGTTPSIIRTGCGAALYFGWLDLLRRQCVQFDIGTVSTAAAAAAAAAAPSSKTSKTSTTTASPAGPTAVAAHLTQTTNLLVGGLARASAGFVMMPVTVIKVHMESSHSSRLDSGAAAAVRTHPTVRSVAADVIRTRGFFRGLFAGSCATAIRDAPYAGLYVVFYEQSKAWLTRLGRSSSSSTSSSTSTPSRLDTGIALAPSTITFGSGVVAASLATVVTNPFDAIKTRLQLYPGRYSSTLGCLADMLKPDPLPSSSPSSSSSSSSPSSSPGRTGLDRVRAAVVGPARNLFSGLGLRIARKGLASALSWTVYEEVVRRVAPPTPPAGDE